MKFRNLNIGSLLLCSLLVFGCSQSAPVINDEEVIVPLKDMNFHFQRSWDFSDTYMIFGGEDLGRSNSVNKIYLSGISMEDALSIYAYFPDFHKCSSPGAAMAQNSLVNLLIVPSNQKILKTLQKVLSEHETNFAAGGDRVSVKLQGSVINMTGAFFKENNLDVTDQIPDQMKQDYYLVQSAEIVKSEIVLKNS